MLVTDSKEKLVYKVKNYAVYTSYIYMFCELRYQFIPTILNDFTISF